MIVTLLGATFVILGLMTLILFQGHRCVRNKLQIMFFRFIYTIVYMLHRSLGIHIFPLLVVVIAFLLHDCVCVCVWIYEKYLSGPIVFNLS